MCIHRKRPRPPGEEALYKYPTHRVGYHPASGLWWRGNPHKRCANRDQTTAVPRQTAHGTLWDPYPVPARGRVAVAAIAERAQVTHTQRARRRQRQPPCAAVQPPRAPRLWDPRHPAPSLPVLTNVRDLRAACRPQAPRDVLLDGTRGGRLSGLKIVGLVVGILVETSIADRSCKVGLAVTQACFNSTRAHLRITYADYISYTILAMEHAANTAF